MIGQGFQDGWRRAAGFLALLAVAALVLLAQPPHAEARSAHEPAASEQAQDGEHHPVSGGAHCASHCASHNAAATVAEAALAVGYGGEHRYGRTTETPPRAVTRAPPTRPPAA